jgi:hypothetical protein
MFTHQPLLPPHLHIFLRSHWVWCRHSLPAAIAHNELCTGPVSCQVENGTVFKPHPHPAIFCRCEAANTSHVLLFKHLYIQMQLLLVLLLQGLLLLGVPGKLWVGVLLLLLLYGTR